MLSHDDEVNISGDVENGLDPNLDNGAEGEILPESPPHLSPMDNSINLVDEVKCLRVFFGGLVR